MKTTITFLLLTMFVFGKAQDGTLDPTFGTNGIQTTINIGIVNNAKKSADNKIYVLGYKKVGSDTDCMIARFTLDGNLDPNFGSGGILLHDYGNINEQYIDIAFEDNGKLLITDRSSNVYRLNNDGSRDLSYGNSGIANVQGLYLANIAGSNKIISAFSFNSACNFTKVSKISDTGNFDTSFASPNGWLYAGLDCSQTNINKGLVTLTNGNIVTLNEPNTVPYGTKILSISSSGLKNTTYNTTAASQNLGFDSNTGARRIFNNENNVFINAIKNAKYYIVKLKETGVLDTSFNTTGKLEITIASVGVIRPTNIEFQNDGKILLFGNYKATTSSSEYNSQFMMVRLLTDGQLDTTFGNQGKVLTLVNGNNTNNPIGIQDSSGTIMIIGNQDYSSDDPNIVAIAKYGNAATLANQETLKTPTKLYPNPVQSTLFFSEELSDIKITDMSGKIVLQNKLRTKNISVENLPKGNYIVTGKNSKGEMISGKIIKN